MKCFITLAIVGITFANTLDAADTFSHAGTFPGGGLGAIASARGDWMHARSSNFGNYAEGIGIALDNDSVSLSMSSAIRSSRCRSAARTMNITVGPGQGSSSSGYARGFGFGSSAAAGGSSNRQSAAAVLRASGQQFETTGRSSLTPNGGYFPRY